MTIQWDWSDDGSSVTADLGNGMTANVAIRPDDYPDLSWLDEDEDPNDYYVHAFHIVVTDRAGIVVQDDWLGGITMSQWTNGYEAQEYGESVLNEMLEIPASRPVAS